MVQVIPLHEVYTLELYVYYVDAPPYCDLVTLP